jgi:hypothetical protein
VAQTNGSGEQGCCSVLGSLVAPGRRAVTPLQAWYTSDVVGGGVVAQPALRCEKPHGRLLSSSDRVGCGWSGSNPGEANLYLVAAVPAAAAAVDRLGTRSAAVWGGHGISPPSLGPSLAVVSNTYSSSGMG